MWDVLLQEIMGREQDQIFKNFIALESGILLKAKAPTSPSRNRRRVNTMRLESSPFDGLLANAISNAKANAIADSDSNARARASSGDSSRSHTSSIEMEITRHPIPEIQVMCTPSTPTSLASKFVRKAKATNNHQYEKLNQVIDETLS